MTLAVWLLLSALAASFVAGFLLWTENRFLRRKNKHMSAVLDRFTAVVPVLETEVATLKSNLATAQASAGTPDSVLEPLVARLETLANPPTVPAPPPVV
jgi:hypothetical protein